VRRVFCVSCFFAVFLPPLGAFAEAPRCPDRAAVTAALAAITSDSDHASSTARADWRLEDLGERYRVGVAGRSREYTDPARNCRARAQVAAVFIMLSLNGDTAEAESERELHARVEAPSSTASTSAEHEAPTASTEPARPRASAKRTPEPIRAASPTFARFELETGISGALAAPSERETAALVRGAYSWSAWGVELGAALPLTSAELQVGVARAALARYPFDFSARYALASSLLRADISGGIELSVLHLRDLSSGAAAPSTRLAPGARFGASLRANRARISPSVGAFFAVTPVRYDLALEPSGTLAKTPALWLGGWIGLAANFD